MIDKKRAKQGENLLITITVAKLEQLIRDIFEVHGFVPDRISFDLDLWLRSHISEINLQEKK